MKPLIIVGAGGFGREVFYLISEMNLHKGEWNAVGFLDDDPHVLDATPGYPPVLGGIRSFTRENADSSAWYVCAIGKPEDRSRVVKEMDRRGVRWATLVHPTASLGPHCTLGGGCVITRLATLTANVVLGDHVHMNIASSCGHDVRVGAFSTLSAHADVTGRATLEEGVFLGSHAVVLPQARVGAWARIGAGSVVLRSVKPGDTVMGVPAKPAKLRRN